MVRINSTKEWLFNNGIPEGKITTEGIAADNPVAGNTTEAGRAKIRRVELNVSYMK